MSTYISTPPPGQFRWPSANSTQGSFSLVAGRTAGSTLVEPLNPYPLHGAQGVQIQFAGLGADNDTADFRVWIVRDCKGVSVAGATPPTTDYDLEYFGGGTATLSTAPYVNAAAAGTTTGRMADTLTWTLSTTGTTPKGPGTVIETAYGSGGSAVYSPTGNLPATLIIPHLGWADSVIVEFDLTGTSTAMWAGVART